MKKLFPYLFVFAVSFLILTACSKLKNSDNDKVTSEQERKEKELKEKEEMLKERESKLQSNGNLQGDGGGYGASSMFPEASERLLTGRDVENLNGWELKIMRNEIYARHGYIFKTPEMKEYFAYEKWYVGKYDNVDNMLTDLEKENIGLIKRYENRLGNNDYSR